MACATKPYFGVLLIILFFFWKVLDHGGSDVTLLGTDTIFPAAARDMPKVDDQSKWVLIL